MIRTEAVKDIERWADEAENGNYHDLSVVLRLFAEVIRDRCGPESLTFVKSTDEFPPQRNIVEMMIEDE